MKALFYSIVVSFCLLFLASCEDDAEIASNNLSKAADNFQVYRRTVFVNTWTGQYELEVIGLCNLDVNNNVEITCKSGDGKFKKHFLGLKGHMNYFVEQLDGLKVSEYHYRYTFKPQSIIPDIDFRGSLGTSLLDSDEQ